MVVEVCFGKRVFSDLLTVLLPPVDFVLVSVYCNGTAPAYAEGTESSFGARSVYDPV